MSEVKSLSVTDDLEGLTRKLHPKKFGDYMPWAIIHDAIDRKFRKEFALSRGEKVKTAYSANEIYESEKYAKTTFPFLYRFHKVCFSIECRFGWFLDWFQKPRRYYNNAYVSKTHIMETGLEKGVWHDSSYVIKEGLFNQIKFFVEQEAKDDFEWFKSMSDEEKKTLPEHQLTMYKEILDAYNWYKFDRPRLEFQKEELYKELPEVEEKDEDLKMWAFMKSDRDYSKIHALDKKIEDEEKTHLMNIIKNVNSLWS